MALISCPECGKRVSDRAAACPDCGYPIATAGGQPEGAPEGAMCESSASGGESDALRADSSTVAGDGGSDSLQAVIEQRRAERRSPRATEPTDELEATASLAPFRWSLAITGFLACCTFFLPTGRGWTWDVLTDLPGADQARIVLVPLLGIALAVASFLRATSLTRGIVYSSVGGILLVVLWMAGLDELDVQGMGWVLALFECAVFGLFYRGTRPFDGLGQVIAAVLGALLTITYLWPVDTAGGQALRVIALAKLVSDASVQSAIAGTLVALMAYFPLVVGILSVVFATRAASSWTGGKAARSTAALAWIWYPVAVLAPFVGPLFTAPDTTNGVVALLIGLRVAIELAALVGVPALGLTFLLCGARRRFV